MAPRLCARVGCAEPAAAVLLMHPKEQHAWLVDLTGESEGFGVALCPVHADRVSVPMGWALADDRSPEPELDLGLPDGEGTTVRVLDLSTAPEADADADGDDGRSDAATAHPADDTGRAGVGRDAPGLVGSDDSAAMPTLWTATGSATPLLSRAFRAAGVGD